MRIDEYQTLAMRTECNQEQAFFRSLTLDAINYQATRLNHAALGIAGEAGEVCTAVERWLQYGHDLDKTNVIEELGDLLWYVALAASTINVSMETIMETNIAKLKKRFPDKFDTELAKEHNRDRVAEARAIEDGINHE